MSQRLLAKRSRRVTAAHGAKQSRSGLKISVREGGLCSTIDDFNRAVLDRTSNKQHRIDMKQLT
jgi:hypothetical protein